MMALWHLVMKVAIYYQMYVNALSYQTAFEGTSPVVMLGWWMVAPASQLAYFLLSRGGLTTVEVIGIGVLGFLESVVSLSVLVDRK